MKKYQKTIVDLLRNRPKKICAEVGVWKGDLVLLLLKTYPEIMKYYCIDLWKHYDDFTAILKPKGVMKNCDFEQVYLNYIERTKKVKDRIINLRMTSKDASKKVADNSLDFIFIDANHATEYAKQDIQLWYPKVKKGGLMSGHDYGNKRFGVTEAVNELLPKAKSKGSVWYIRI